MPPRLWLRLFDQSDMPAGLALVIVGRAIRDKVRTLESDEWPLGMAAAEMQKLGQERLSRTRLAHDEHRG